MPHAVSVVVGLRALQPDPGIIQAVGKVLMGAASPILGAVLYLRKFR